MRYVMTSLWIVPLQSIDILTHQRNNILKVNGNYNSIKYMHAAEFSPVQDTWAKAVNCGYLNTWPLLTEK